ncbi:MAG: rhomboid family intramembrane serine protease [Bacteroidia bacterium]|nr:rhomboid family intramembrane serine protease [Bacteroidia bacterium]
MRPHLTDTVRHLVILNVMIFVGLMLLPGYVRDEWFVLHKQNLILQRPTIEVDDRPYFVPEGFRIPDMTGERVRPDQEMIDTLIAADPSVGAQLAANLRILAADAFIPIQLVTSFFNHSHYSFFHILFNMLFLASLGSLVEMALGARRFLLYYLFSGVMAGVLLAFFDPSPVPVVGASTALSGVLVAVAYYFPDHRLGVLFIPVQFPARDFVLLYATGSVVLMFMGWRNPAWGGQISHFGHLAGMGAGMLYLVLERYMPFLQDRRRP